jgi:hypothetical protein
MKYDDASWHYGGEFPEDLPKDAAATHTGMFLAWALLKGLGGELFVDEEPELVQQLENRTITPGQFFLRNCDGKLIDEDFSEQGNAFAEAYFDLQSGDYLADYESLVGDELPSLYHVPDSWETFDRLRPHLDERYSAWLAADA